MSDNYFNIIKGGYIRAYLKYYLDLKYLFIEPYDWGYKIEATTKLNELNIYVTIDRSDCTVEKLCEIALSMIKNEIIKQYINPHL